jgi:hypothetical protein
LTTGVARQRNFATGRLYNQINFGLGAGKRRKQGVENDDCQ